MRAHGPWLAVVWMCWGCGTAAETPPGADAVALGDADATDVVGVDAALPDVPAADSPDVSVADTAAVDAPIPSDTADAADIGSEGDVALSCSALTTQIQALQPGLTPCTTAIGCQTFAAPICNSFGCFQLPVAANADTSALMSLANQALAAGCPEFHCGCGAEQPSFCLNGQCRQCPPDCDGACSEVTTVLTTHAHAVNWCSTADDCTVISTGLCPVGDLPCGGLYASKYAQTEALQAAITAYAKACGASTCKCAVPSQVACVEGKCVGN